MRIVPIGFRTPAATGIPDVEFLAAEQVYETSGSAVTSMSGAYTPPGSADLVVAAALGRNGSSNFSGMAATLNGVAGTKISTDEGFGTNRPHVILFTWTTIGAGTLEVTRSGGTFLSGQIFALAFSNVDSVGTPVKSGAVSSAGPAQVSITPTLVGSMIIGVINWEHTNGLGDDALTAVNLTERLDLVATGTGSTDFANGAAGTELVAGTSARDVGFSSGTADDWWTAHAVELLKAT